MIEELLNDLEKMNVLDPQYDTKYNILLQNVNHMNNEQLKKLKKLTLKKLEYDSGIYEQEVERIK